MRFASFGIKKTKNKKKKNKKKKSNFSKRWNKNPYIDLHIPAAESWNSGSGPCLEHFTRQK